MQPLQLTNDAGFKFELWKKLLGEYLCDPSNERKDKQVSVQAALHRVALPIVQSHLPRRVREPCCLAGSCATPSVPFVHRSVHLGRHEVETVSSCRDEFCFCLAHSTACAGAAVDLTVRGYYASGNDMRSRHRGLRCLLRHTRVRSVRFENVDNQHDAREVVSELGLRMQQSGTCSVWQELHPTQCSLTPNAFRSLLTCLRRCDTLTHVSLEGCHVGSSALIGHYVRSTTALTHLSLSGTTMASDWASVGSAVAKAPSVVHLDVSACNWQDTPHLLEFIASFTGFAPRPRFALDVSSNALTSQCFAVLAGGGEAFVAGVTDLLLGTHRFMEDDEALSQLLNAYTLLDSISFRGCTLGVGAAQRLLRGLGDKKRVWRLVDVADTNIAIGSFKRVCQATFAPSVSSLCCDGVDLHGQLTRLTFASCASVLSSLSLSRCSLTDECVGQLASALEKAAPLPLRHLALAHNAVDKRRAKGNGSFLYLCKALRAHNAPLLESLDLSGNKLPLLPLAALVEQVSCALRHIDLSHTSLADSAVDRVRVLTTLMRRQRGATRFPLLDVFMASTVEEAWVGMKEVHEWLATQTSVRLEVVAAAVGGRGGRRRSRR